MATDNVTKQVLEEVNGRWCSMYAMVERIGGLDEILKALRSIGNRQEYIVRKRNPTPDAENDAMLREYRAFAYGCTECGETIDQFHKATCKFKATLVVKSQTKEW